MAKVPSAETQAELVTLLQGMVKDSDAKLADRVPGWEQVEKSNRSYIPKADAERRNKTAAESMEFTKIVIPYSYAMKMAAHTYLASVFLSRPVIFQYDSKSGKGQDEVLAAEALVNHNVISGGISANLYFFFSDLLDYGISALGSYWEEETTYVTAYGKKQVEVNGVVDPENTEDTEQVIEFEGYKGNKCFNVKPKELIVDPSVGFARFQEGSFFGRRLQMKVADLQRGEKLGKYFNTNLIATDESKDAGLSGDNPALLETTPTKALEMKYQKGYANLYEIYAKVVPADAGLGSNPNEEVWVFTLANARTLIGAAPAGWAHGKYPYDVAVAEFDAYTLSSRGFPEIGEPLNQTLNWLINSHMYNVEKSVNNEYLYDPSMINMVDFLDPRPGKRIRIKSAAYGKDVRTFIHQFQQVNSTQSNFADISLVEQLFQRVFGINEQMLGAMSGGGGRKTATEVRSSNGFGLNRLKVLAEFISVTFMAPLSTKLLKNCFQMYDEDTKFQLTKDAGKGKFSEGFTIKDIMGEYAFAPVDGTLPIDRFAQTQIYTELLTAIQSLPQVAGRYDVATLFAFITNLAGIKNLSSFEIMDESKIKREAELGNLVVNGGQRGQAGTIGNRPEGASGIPQV